MALKQFDGKPRVAVGTGWQSMSAEEFKRRAVKLLGTSYAKHMAGLLGMDRSTFQQFAKGGPKGRVVPRYMAVILTMLEEYEKRGIKFPDHFLDYEVKKVGPPVGTVRRKRASV